MAPRFNDGVASRLAADGSWDPAKAARALVEQVYDPDAMPVGSDEEGAFMVLLRACKRMIREGR